MMKNALLKKFALCGILSALGVIAFVIESLFPPIFLPGARMGVSNIFILLAVIICGWQYGFAALIIKVLLGSLFSGNISAIMYSLPAGVLSLGAEILLLYFTKKISVVAISVFGAVVNTTVQNATFCLIIGIVEYFYYLPYLAAISILSGLIVGFAVCLTVKKLPLKILGNL